MTVVLFPKATSFDLELMFVKSVLRNQIINLKINKKEPMCESWQVN
tara:strand:- start:440 stop:577 length:138 start_codon:yes stop_codon:yes gene_type:complete